MSESRPSAEEIRDQYKNHCSILKNIPAEHDTSIDGIMLDIQAENREWHASPPPRDELELQLAEREVVVVDSLKQIKAIVGTYIANAAMYFRDSLGRYDQILLQTIKADILEEGFNHGRMQHFLQQASTPEARQLLAACLDQDVWVGMQAASASQKPATLLNENSYLAFASSEQARKAMRTGFDVNIWSAIAKSAAERSLVGNPFINSYLSMASSRTASKGMHVALDQYVWNSMLSETDVGADTDTIDSLANLASSEETRQLFLDKLSATAQVNHEARKLVEALQDSEQGANTTWLSEIAPSTIASVIAAVCELRQSHANPDQTLSDLAVYKHFHNQVNVASDEALSPQDERAQVFAIITAFMGGSAMRGRLPF